jgi:hypothetical protein
MQGKTRKIRLAGLVTAAVAAAVVGSARIPTASAASCIGPYYGAQCAPDNPLDARGHVPKPIHHKKHLPNAGNLRRCQGPYNRPVTCPY